MAREASAATPCRFSGYGSGESDYGYYDSDNSLRRKVFKNLVKDVEAHGNRLTTGDVGNRYLIQTLANYGANELIYKMFNHEEAPDMAFSSSSARRL